MALTRDFKGTVLARVQADPAFRAALLKEGIETMLSGDIDAGKAILRDYIKATVGFGQPGVDVGSSPKSLIRMLRVPVFMVVCIVCGYLRSFSTVSINHC